jgi:hypothetical protein
VVGTSAIEVEVVVGAEIGLGGRRSAFEAGWIALAPWRAPRPALF